MFDPESVDLLREVARTLDSSERESRGKAKAAVKKGTLSIERGAKVRAPVDTGFLMNSTTSDITGTGINDPIIGETGPEADYGIHVELGTHRMAPQPFLGPAFDEVEPSFIAAMEDIAGGTLDG